MQHSSTILWVARSYGTRLLMRLMEEFGKTSSSNLTKYFAQQILIGAANPPTYFTPELFNKELLTSLRIELFWSEDDTATPIVNAELLQTNITNAGGKCALTKMKRSSLKDLSDVEKDQISKFHLMKENGDEKWPGHFPELVHKKEFYKLVRAAVIRLQTEIANLSHHHF